ncbi:hypothetical protein KW805_05040 [Candidatus Pacearchaeota archaeon]|nr:hypothetical protein [Candidatus Pacearchaeota archaeon]
MTIEMFGKALAASRPVPKETRNIRLEGIPLNKISAISFMRYSSDKNFANEPEYVGKQIVGERVSERDYRLHVFDLEMHANKYKRLTPQDSILLTKVYT